MSLKSGEELIKYITERAVGYMETSKSERKQYRHTHNKDSWSYHWFGMIPLALHIWKEQRRSKK